ncbi:MAG TPA: Vms1/Ankzf1 family peptidyl-tRNA hydrolase [Gemmatimonadales bacterium]
MRLDFLRPLYRYQGPFISIYLDSSRTDQRGAAEVELRWRRLSELLAERGATEAELAPVHDLVSDPASAVPGQALFLAGGRIVYAEALPNPPRRQTARLSPLPHVMPLLAQRGENVPHLRVMADHTGADVLVIAAGSPRELTVAAETWPLQKTAQGGWSQKRYERGVELTWERNAMAVARVIDEEVRRLGAELVILAGETKSRALVRDHVGKEAADRIVVVEHGARGPGAGLRLFTKEVEAVLDDHLGRRRAAMLDTYGTGRGRGLAVDGLTATVRALRERRVSDLLIVDDPSADGMLWTGPDGDQLATDAGELRQWGVADPVRERTDAALARAAALSDAELWFVSPPELDSADGVAAILRF